ncbi:hypothetical protein N7471_007118 [Penicillium samsonianum]|uniref:uncharacterized protein n=1 Tax=Penicillium samsonianum TaxID=1882272 RepID=UPI002548EE6F|nr:uncharacterized protein N7471_007118 [Penicillium samsonianum]KAJ6131903.1 hypothetical protein N7471_007118 [Penicillium samsonianum]
MSNLSNQTAKEIELQDRERQLRRRELELDYEKHELKLEHSKAELEKHELRIKQRKVELEKHELRVKQDKGELEKNEVKLKDKIEKLNELETELRNNGPDIIRLAISKKFRRGMIGTKERELEHGKDVNALQRCRYERYVYEQDLDSKEDRLAEFLDVETRLREIAQREISLKEQYEQDPTRVEQEFKKTEKEYKRLEHEGWMILDSFADGPLGRALNLWRGHPRWYMHRVLREDCAGRGGCCGRECGCCLNRKLDEPRRRAAGHCTVECGCCQKARGFELSEDEKKVFSIRYAVSQDGKKGIDLKDTQMKNLELQNLRLQNLLSEHSTKDNVIRYTFTDGVAEYERYLNEDAITDSEAEFTDDDECPADEEDPYYRRISQASIWGLVDGNFENPFDLIDEEPACDPTWQIDSSGERPSNVVGQEDKDSMMTETDW